MRGKIKSSEVPATSKPNGGYSSGSAPLDGKSAGAAMNHGDFAEAMRLLNAGVAPDDIRTPQGASALLCSIAQDNLSFAETLLGLGADPNRPPGDSHDKTYLGHVLSGASPAPRQPMIELLLAHGADPNLPCSSSGELPLGVAAANALAGPARALAAKGADPFAADAAGICAAERALSLPDFQKSVLLWAMLPPPAPAGAVAKLAAMLGEDEPMASWLREAWSGGQET